MAELSWSAEALAWLEAIHGYIATDNPSAAAKVVDGIVQRAGQLHHFPDMGARLRRQTEGELRVLLYGHYRIAYLPHRLPASRGQRGRIRPWRVSWRCGHGPLSAMTAGLHSC